MNLYELTYLASPELVREEVSSYQKKLQTHTESVGGAIKASQEPKRTELAYEINKVKYAYLGSFEFEIEKDKIPGIKVMLEKEENIIRHLVIEKKRITKKEKERSQKKERKKRTLRPTPRKESVSTKASLDELGDKINEIL